MFEYNEEKLEQKIISVNDSEKIGDIQKNIDTSCKLIVKNNIIGYLGDNIDRKVIYEILDKKFEKFDDLKNLDIFLQTLPDNVREKKTREILRLIKNGASQYFEGGTTDLVKKRTTQHVNDGSSQLNKNGSNVEYSKICISPNKTENSNLKKSSSLNYSDKEKHGDTIISAFKTRSSNLKEIFKSDYSDNNTMKHLGLIVEQSIENGENPFISKGNNQYYAIKVPKDAQSSFGNSEINTNNRNDSVFVIENLDEKEISKLKTFAISKLKERLYGLVEKSKNPHELIKDKDFFNQFKQYVYLDTKNISDKLKEDEVKCIEDFYKTFLHQELFLEVEGLDIDIENEWKRREDEINREYFRIIVEAQEKARELNNRKVDKNLDEFIDKGFETKKNRVDFNTASGVAIAEELNLGSKLGKYTVKLDSYDVNYSDLQEIAFDNERQDFINNNDNLNGIITKDDIVKYNIFDKERNMLNLDGRQNFCKESSTVKLLEDKEHQRLWGILQNQFFLRYENTFSALLNNPSKQKESVNNYIKNYAIGSVIDNIKSIFTKMAKNFEGDLSDIGFIFSGSEPAKIDGNNLIINGKFNGTNSTIRYDLSTGEVFMNSFIQYNITDNKFKIGENSGAYQKIGNFENFTDYLSNKYESKFQNLEDIKNISSNIKLIGEEITNASKKQSAKNTAVMKLLKTYNILGYPGCFENIDFNSDSKFFEFIKIIDSTAENQINGIQNLDFFNNKFMTTIMEYAGLTWGENNSEQKKDNPKSSILFNENDDNETIKYLRDKIKDFNPDAFKGVGNFDYSQNLGIIDLILKDMLNESKTELSISKMENFIIKLETGGEKY